MGCKLRIGGLQAARRLKKREAALAASSALGGCPVGSVVRPEGLATVGGVVRPSNAVD
jgi:hypothetical protein